MERTDLNQIEIEELKKKIGMPLELHSLRRYWWDIKRFNRARKSINEHNKAMILYYHEKHPDYQWEHQFMLNCYGKRIARWWGWYRKLVKK